MIERIFCGSHGLALLRQNLVEGVPEGLRGKALGRETPLGSEDGLLVPVADFGLRTGITDAVNGGEQEIGSGAGSGTRSRPQGFQQRPHAGLFCSQPQGAGEAEVSQGGGERDGGGLLLDEFSEFFGGAQIGLMDDAGFTVDAGAFDEVVVEAVAFFLLTRLAIKGNTYTTAHYMSSTK